MIIEAGNKVRNTGPSLYKFESKLVSQNILVPYNQNLRSQLSCPLYTYPSQCLCLFMWATGQLDTTGRDFHYPRSLNISLHLIISDFARRRQSLKSKCSQIREFVYKLIQNIDRSCLLFRELSSLAKCKMCEKTTPRQFVKNKVRETLSDLGNFLYQ